jgi:molybdenum cofactor biosynthesis enzyme MoaA
MQPVISLALQHTSTGISFAPERSPYRTLFVDVTHRCNMSCSNCYIPNRELPDMDRRWLMDILRRLPRRTRIRLAGAEATVRRDLPELIRGIREAGHTPALLTNGLKLARPGYAGALKKAGLRTVYLSLNGGLDDDLYEHIDGLRCAQRKLAALGYMRRENMYVTSGTILVRGANESHLGAFLGDARVWNGVREYHFRSVGAMGRHMTAPPLTLAEMKTMLFDALKTVEPAVEVIETNARNFDFWFMGRKFAITQWPDLGSESRGRLTPDGRVEPFFEHVMANASLGGY